jgi:hypothetical protein
VVAEYSVKGNVTECRLVLLLNSHLIATLQVSHDAGFRPGAAARSPPVLATLLGARTRGAPLGSGASRAVPQEGRRLAIPGMRGHWRPAARGGAAVVVQGLLVH